MLSNLRSKIAGLIYPEGVANTDKLRVELARTEVRANTLASKVAYLETLHGKQEREAVMKDGDETDAERIIRLSSTLARKDKELRKIEVERKKLLTTNNNLRVDLQMLREDKRKLQDNNKRLLVEKHELERKFSRGSRKYNVRRHASTQGGMSSLHLSGGDTGGTSPAPTR